MGRYERRDFATGWIPSSDAFKCPPDGLLRGDNLVLDELGALALRQGSAKINGSALASTDVHSLFTTSLSGTRYRMTGATNQVFANGSSIATGFAGTATDDITFGAHRSQILFARSTTKKKYNGTTVNNWGIAAPAAAVTLAAIPADTKTFASGTSSESPAFTANEGSVAFGNTDYTGSGTSATMTLSATTGRGTITKVFAAPMDFTTLDGGATATDEDLIDFYFFMVEPQYLVSLTLQIEVNDGSFNFDWYEHTFFPGQETEIVPASDNSLDSNYDVEGYQRELAQALLDHPLDTPPVASFNPSKLASGSWSHFSIPRGLMERHGSTSGKNWSTVKAVRMTVLNTTGGSGAEVRVSQIQEIGGAVRPLTGKYKGILVAVNNDGTYEALSPPSAQSNEVEVKQQGITATLDATSVAALDSQVNELWLYLMGGRVNAFYRYAVQTVSAIADLSFDYTQTFETAYFTSVSGLADFTSQFETDYGGTVGPRTHNNSWEATYLVATDPITISVTSSDVTAAVANIRLVTDAVVPPNSIIGIEGPHYDRTLCLTATSIYPSKSLNPDTYSEGQVVTVGDAAETALWLKKLGEGGLYLGTTRDVYRLDGDWVDLPSGLLNVAKIPLGVSHPPISSAVTTGKINGSEILVYLSGNGWEALGGGTLTQGGAVDLLWRGETRHGVSPVNITSTTARFRVAIAKNQLIALTPEGSDTTSSATLHRYDFSKQRWYRHTYPQAFRSLYAEKDGTVIAGDASGYVRTLDNATKQDDGSDISIILWTGVDDNGEPFTYKDPENLQIRIDTGSNTATIAYHLDGSSTADTSATTAQSISQTGVLNMSAVTEATQIQLRITGSFSTFTFRGYALNYLDTPMPYLFHDTGFIDLGLNTLSWLRAIVVKAKTAVTLTVTPYFDGTAYAAQTITADFSGTPYPYEVPLGREAKGRQARITVSSTSPSQVYWIELQYNQSGKFIQKRIERFRGVA